MKKPFAIVLLILILAVSGGYLRLLDTIWPFRGFRFHTGWEDNTLETLYESAWIDSDFEQGWKVVRTSETSWSGFKAEKGYGVLFTNFTGYNYAHERGLTGVTVQKSLGGIETAAYPHLVINHMESTSDNALSFSFSLTDENGTVHEGGLRHTSASSDNLNVDLRRIYNGTINFLSIRLANDYDPSYKGGIQKSYLKQIVISKKLPQWMLSYNKPVSASISTAGGTMKVYASGNLSDGTIVTAQRPNDVTLDLERYSYLQIRTKTSSIDVAARVVIWTDSSHHHVVLLKTYNDADWHTEIVDLKFFGIGGENLHLIELGLLQISTGVESIVYYQQLSFDRLEVLVDTP